MRWFVYHLPELACAFVAMVLGMPVVLGGLTQSPAGGTRWGAGGGQPNFTGNPSARGGSFESGDSFGSPHYFSGRSQA